MTQAQIESLLYTIKTINSEDKKSFKKKGKQTKGKERKCTKTHHSPSSTLDFSLRTDMTKVSK